MIPHGNLKPDKILFMNNNDIKISGYCYSRKDSKDLQMEIENDFDKDI